MIKLWNNPILRGLAAFLATYWTIGLSAPGPWFTALLASFLLALGLILILSYAPDALVVIKDGRIGDDRLALLGLFALALGSVYSGIFTLLWTFAGNPPAWLGTAGSGFGRAMMIGGFGLLTVSPNVTRDGIRLPRWPVIVVTVAAVGVAAFFLGMHWQGDRDDVVDALRPAVMEGGQRHRSAR